MEDVPPPLLVFPDNDGVMELPLILEECEASRNGGAAPPLCGCLETIGVRFASPALEDVGM